MLGHRVQRVGTIHAGTSSTTCRYDTCWDIEKVGSEFINTIYVRSFIKPWNDSDQFI